MAVGLPWGEAGAGETGYLTIGAGRVAREKIRLQETLGGAVAQSGKSQLRVAEAPTYAHITRVMNGLSDDPLENEYRMLIPPDSPTRRDAKPEMMTHEIAERAMQGIEEGIDLVIAGIAAPDEIAHTGNFAATAQALRATDEALGMLMKTAFARGAALVITSDHGNAERMRNPKTGATETRHDTDPVPMIVAGNGFESRKSPERALACEKETTGTLADVAPTVLEILGVSKPNEMTGTSLLERLA